METSSNVRPSLISDAGAHRSRQVLDAATSAAAIDAGFDRTTPQIPTHTAGFKSRLNDDEDSADSELDATGESTTSVGAPVGP